MDKQERERLEQNAVIFARSNREHRAAKQKIRIEAARLRFEYRLAQDLSSEARAKLDLTYQYHIRENGSVRVVCYVNYAGQKWPITPIHVGDRHDWTCGLDEHGASSLLFASEYLEECLLDFLAFQQDQQQKREQFFLTHGYYAS